MQGKTVKSIGAGLFAWPHGFDMDEEGNFWITEVLLRETRSSGAERAWATKWLNQSRVRL